MGATQMIELLLTTDPLSSGWYFTFIMIMLVCFVWLVNYHMDKDVKLLLSEPVKTILKKLKETPECFVFTTHNGISGDRYIHIMDKDTLFRFMITEQELIGRPIRTETNLPWVTFVEEKALIDSFTKEAYKRENDKLRNEHLEERQKIAKLYNVEIKK